MKTIIGTLAIAGLMAFSPLSQAAELNINTATSEQLMQLKGIGEKKAQAIIDWRKTNGPFTNVEQLADVKGISTNTLKRMDTTLLLDNNSTTANAMTDKTTTTETAAKKTATTTKAPVDAKSQQIVGNGS